MITNNFKFEDNKYYVSIKCLAEATISQISKSNLNEEDKNKYTEGIEQLINNCKMILRSDSCNTLTNEKDMLSKMVSYFCVVSSLTSLSKSLGK